MSALNLLSPALHTSIEQLSIISFAPPQISPWERFQRDWLAEIDCRNFEALGLQAVDFLTAVEMIAPRFAGQPVVQAFDQHAANTGEAIQASPSSQA